MGKDKVLRLSEMAESSCHYTAEQALLDALQFVRENQAHQSAAIILWDRTSRRYRWYQAKTTDPETHWYLARFQANLLDLGDE